jgi:protein-L-isoaspartate O-methyltransferase
VISILPRLRRRPAPAAPGRLRPDDVFALPQAVWGAGFSAPGNPAFVAALVDGCELRPTSLVVDLTAGLGGRARALAAAFGCYVTGIERDHARAGRAMRLSEEAGLARAAAIRAYNPTDLALRRGAFDLAIADGLLADLVEKELLLRAVHEGLRRGGRLVLTELVGLDGEAQLWTEEQYLDCLAGLGFAPDPPSDLSTRYTDLVRDAWQGFLGRVDIRALGTAFQEEVTAQLEFWTERAHRLDSGQLRYVKLAARAETPRRAGSLDSRKRGSYVPRPARDKDFELKK